MNAPNRSDSYTLPDGAQKVSYEKDTKIPNAGKFTILREDHTIGNLIRMQSLRDPNVTFSGYRHPHPLNHDIVVRIQTNDASSPVEALANCLDDLSTVFDELVKKFRRLTGNSKDAGNAFS
uniref:DNAdirected RNA polymerase II subunit J putative n=1 Tax=Albugo laibachii Nc14 TaxID=890382 RepID=F0X1I4_9STRA|nr:DNAdirected RNA polymerase II subunit J putative [Albugo laibachii Nc14]|eukprot:CCA27671.1 DNAdirected RNA polymerase II subunit J putative [Albugo laibachii Nc14]